MIIVRLIGGLGNQMFQYALGRSISALHNTELKFDTSYLEEKNNAHTARYYELGAFGINAVANDAELKPYYNIQNSRIRRRLHRNLPQWLFSHHIITEPSHAFHAEILKSPNNSLLTGFWQTEKYFTGIEETIRSNFKFTTPLDYKSKAIADKINSSNSLSLHIRRGDYIANQAANKYHGIINKEYYAKAVNLISSRHNNSHLFIFSDDIEWTKQHLQFDTPTDYIQGNNAIIDMQLMSLCKHNIIANSSFSWWGAWLNQNKNKIVIAPDKWFNKSSIDTKDVIPSNWIKL